jgi:hypothetical protein
MTNDTTKQVYIYALKEMGTSNLRYIGHTGNIKLRMYGHKTLASHTGNEAFSKWLESVGNNLEYEILNIVPASEARKHEEKYIRMKRSEGHDLLNIRQAAQKIYTKEQAHQILAATLDDVVR